MKVAGFYLYIHLQTYMYTIIFLKSQRFILPVRCSSVVVFDAQASGSAGRTTQSCR